MEPSVGSEVVHFDTGLHIHIVSQGHSTKRYGSKEKALLGFEPRISCLLDRRFNQLSHSA